MERQYTSKIFLVFLASLAATLAADGPTMKVSLSKKMVKPGETAELICEVGNLARTDFIKFVKKVKGTFKLMATNTMGDGIFRKWFDSKRYTVQYESQPGKYDSKFTLVIKNAELADAGEIGCQVPMEKKEDLVQLKNLTVLVAPSSVQMSIINGSKTIEVTKNMEMQMEHGNYITVKCFAQGSAPAAQMSFTIGKEVYKGKVTSVAKPPPNEGIEAIKYETTLTKDVMVESTFNKNAIQCKASTKGLDKSEKKSSSLTVKMSGSPPQFMCESNTVMVKLGQRNVVLNCSVHSTPAATFYKWYWYRNRPDAVQNNLTISIGNGERDGHYIGEVVKGAGEDEQVMLLKIDIIAAQMFRDHFFVAKNELGSTTYTMKIVKDPKSVVGSAVQNYFASSLMATLLLLCLCLRV